MASTKDNRTAPQRSLRVHPLPVGPFQANCYVVWGPSSHALVIDPGAEPDRIAEFLRAHGLTPDAYLLTHGHVDHVYAAAELADSLTIPVAIHPADLEWAFSNENQWPPFYGIPRRPKSLRLLHGIENGHPGGLSYRVLSTPGHSPGSVCFFFPEPGVLFTGDTLFAGSVGRTDLPGGDSRALQASLRSLLCLGDATQVYPGHGPSTTVQQEKKGNYFLSHIATAQEHI